MENIGPYIKNLRQLRGIPPNDVAKYLNISADTLLSIEKEKINATKNQIFELAAFFNADEKEMLTLFQRDRIISQISNFQLLDKALESERYDQELAEFKNGATKRYSIMVSEFAHLLKNQVTIKLYKPAPPLNMFIENIIYCKDYNVGYSYEKVLPDASSQMIIELDDRDRVLLEADKKQDIKLSKAWVTCMPKQYLTYKLPKSETTVYIRFRPSGLFAFTQIPQSELTIAAIDAEALFGKSISRLREVLLNTDDIRQVFVLIEQYFLKKLHKEFYSHPVIDYLCENQNKPIAELVKKSGYSQKHLIHLFKKHVGVSPKYYQRICKFNEVLNQIHSTKGKINWTSLVFKNNYYDQAHFIREFKYFAGISPQSYLETGSTCTKFIHTNTLR